MAAEAAVRDGAPPLSFEQLLNRELKVPHMHTERKKGKGGVTVTHSVFPLTPIFTVVRCNDERCNTCNTCNRCNISITKSDKETVLKKRQRFTTVGSLFQPTLSLSPLSPSALLSHRLSTHTHSPSDSYKTYGQNTNPYRNRTTHPSFTQLSISLHRFGMTKPHALKEFHSPADSAKLPLPPRTLKLRSPAKDSSPAAPGSPGPRAAGTSARLPSPRSSPQRPADRAAPVRPGGGNTQSTKAAASRRPWRPANRRGAGAAWSADDAVDEAASETSFLLTRSQWERQQLEEEEELEEFEQLESIVTPVPAASVG